MRNISSLLLAMIGKWRFAKNICMGVLSGLSSFLFVNLMTWMISQIASQQYGVIREDYIVVFGASIFIFVWVRRTLAIAIIDLSQDIFWNLRNQLVSLILTTNYQNLSLEKTKVHSAIVHDINVLTQASMALIDFSTAAIVSIACFVYLSFLSFSLFLLTLLIALIGVTVYQFGAKRNNQSFLIAREKENDFFKHFSSILDGFKEINIDPAKGQYIMDRTTAIMNEAAKNNRNAFTGFLNNQITGQVLFYMLISSVLLFFSLLFEISTSDTIIFTIISLYLLSSIETIMVFLPGLSKAKIAAVSLIKLKSDLEKVQQPNQLPTVTFPKSSFKQLSIRRLMFRYDGNDNAFSIGPIDLDISKGDVIFIYGGNGSGKTTFLFSLLGLNPQSSADIRLNGITVANFDAHYRSVFAVMFSDFYLFDELVGLHQVDFEKWNYYIDLFELSGKVKLEGRCFSTTGLSAGQKKRLALVATLLEEKPVLVLDEWAADQDPYFREKFYTEIIPLLKDQGISVLAITHDDKYYPCADKLYKMDYGMLMPESIFSFGRDIN